MHESVESCPRPWHTFKGESQDHGAFTPSGASELYHWHWNCCQKNVLGPVGILIHPQNSVRAHPEPMSANPSILEKSSGLANVSWPMNHVVNWVLADPSTMEVMAEHYVVLAPQLVLCHGSDHDACLQGRPRVARPSNTSAENIGRKECRESQRKHMDRSDGSGREY